MDKFCLSLPFLFMYTTCSYKPQFLSMEIFFLVVFSINFGISAPWNKQTLVKIGSELRVQRTYLKKLSTKNTVGGGFEVTEKYCFIPSTIKY